MLTRVSLVACIVLLVHGSLARANGINPPRPSGALLVTASCADRSADISHEVLRAAIVTLRGRENSITFRTGSLTEEIPIVQINRITLPSEAIDPSGFTEALLIRADATGEQRGAVQVKLPEALIRLEGYRTNSNPIGVELRTCRVLEFRNSAASAIPVDTASMPKR